MWALPPSATKAALTRGCLHANKLVAYVTLNVVLCALRRLGAVTACLRTTDSDSGSGSCGVGSSTGHSSGSSSSGGGAVVVAPISAGASSVAEVKARRAAAAALATAPLLAAAFWHGGWHRRGRRLHLVRRRLQPRQEVRHQLVGRGDVTQVPHDAPPQGTLHGAKPRRLRGIGSSRCHWVRRCHVVCRRDGVVVRGGGERVGA